MCASARARARSPSRAFPPRPCSFKFRPPGPYGAASRSQDHRCAAFRRVAGRRVDLDSARAIRSSPCRAKNLRMGCSASKRIPGRDERASEIKTAGRRQPRRQLSSSKRHENSFAACRAPDGRRPGPVGREQLRRGREICRWNSVDADGSPPADGSSSKTTDRRAPRLVSSKTGPPSPSAALEGGQPIRRGRAPFGFQTRWRRTPPTTKKAGRGRGPAGLKLAATASRFTSPSSGEISRLIENICVNRMPQVERPRSVPERTKIQAADVRRAIRIAARRFLPEVARSCRANRGCRK